MKQIFPKLESCSAIIINVSCQLYKRLFHKTQSLWFGISFPAFVLSNENLAAGVRTIVFRHSESAHAERNQGTGDKPETKPELQRVVSE